MKLSPSNIFIHDLILRQLNQHCSASLNQNQICRRDLSLNAQNLSLKTFKEWLHSSLRDREVRYFSRCFWNKHMPLQKKLCLSIANMQQVICVRIYFQYWRQIFVHRDGSLCTAGPTFHGQSTTTIIITVTTHIITITTATIITIANPQHYHHQQNQQWHCILDADLMSSVQ